MAILLHSHKPGTVPQTPKSQEKNLLAVSLCASGEGKNRRQKALIEDSTHVQALRSS
jgi:hypothetical protein